MKPELYQEIVAKRPELKVTVCRDLVLCAQTDAPPDRVWFTYDGGVFEHWGEDNEIMMAYTHALIFTHWTEKMPKRFYIAQLSDGSFMAFDDFDDWCFPKGVETHAEALTEFWRTYEGG